jgi:hypothetical protein
MTIAQREEIVRLAQLDVAEFNDDDLSTIHRSQIQVTPDDRTPGRIDRVSHGHHQHTTGNDAMASYSISQFKEGRHFFCDGIGSGVVVRQGAGSTRVRWRGGSEESISRGTQVQPTRVVLTAAPVTTQTTPDDTTTNDDTPAKKTRPSRLVFNTYTATAVLRWMGSMGWEFEEAVRVFDVLTIDVALSTVKIQLVAGSRGKRGAPAPLTDEQGAELDTMLAATSVATK